MYKILGTDQKEYGPVSAEQVKEWILQRRANAQTKVQPEGATDWRPLADFPEFAQALSQAAGPRPAAPAPIAPPLSATPTGPQVTSGLAITSLVLGILGLVSCGLLSLVALPVGIVALVKIDRSHGRLGGKGLALAGTITSGVSLLLIPLLAAMLLPALVKAKHRAHAIVCMNNVRQIDLGLIMYANSHNGQLPAGDKWCEAIQSSIGASTNVFLCPADGATRQIHYALNARLAGTDLKSISSPGTTVLVFEGTGGWDLSGGKELLPSTPPHDTVYNIGFVDGHVEAVRPNRLSQLRWDP